MVGRFLQTKKKSQKKKMETKPQDREQKKNLIVWLKTIRFQFPFNNLCYPTSILDHASVLLLILLLLLLLRIKNPSPPEGYVGLVIVDAADIVRDDNSTTDIYTVT